MKVTKAITERRSIRRFLPKEVPTDIIKTILADASRAPSGTNTQPWKVTCVTGKKKEQLSRAISDAIKNDQANLEYQYMPSKLREPYITRKRRVGYALYELYGIARDDYPARKQAMLRNFEFFGAPLGLFFRMDRDLLFGSWLDMGMFMQNVMILARAHGLESCPQQAWCEFGSTVHKVLDIPEDEIIISGMSLGYAAKAPENTLISERADVDEFAIFLE
jgi:nitroreductase